MINIQDSLKQALEEIETQNQVGRILLMLSLLGDKKLLAMESIFESLSKLDCCSDDLEEKNRQHWGHTINNIVSFIEMIGSGQMLDYFLTNFIYNHKLLITAAHYLPEPLRNSQAVLGALALIHRARKLRSFDLEAAAINWAKNLGEPVSDQSVGDLKSNFPFLMPVAFRSGIDLAELTLYKQFFGLAPGLRGFTSSANKKLFCRACKKWPLEDIFALCPLPSWPADSKGEELWFEKHNWPEQQNELLRLQRMFPGVIVRFATMPELMFLDLSWRLISGGESPMDIYSFRCEHPNSSDKCLLYGGVDKYGAEVEADKYPRYANRQVLPLFILKAKMEK